MSRDSEGIYEKIEISSREGNSENNNDDTSVIIKMPDTLYIKKHSEVDAFLKGKRTDEFAIQLRKRGYPILANVELFFNQHKLWLSSIFILTTGFLTWSLGGFNAWAIQIAASPSTEDVEEAARKIAAGFIIVGLVIITAIVVVYNKLVGPTYEDDQGYEQYIPALMRSYSHKNEAIENLFSPVEPESCQLSIGMHVEHLCTLVAQGRYHAVGLALKSLREHYGYFAPAHVLVEEKGEEIQVQHHYEKITDSKKYSKDFDRNEMPGDGNCLFHAISDQLKRFPDKKQYDHAELRQLAVKYINDHIDEYAPFLHNKGGVCTYINRMRQDGEWGGELEVSILSKILEVEIHLHNHHISPKTSLPHASTKYGVDENYQHIMHLSYEGLHYESLVPIEETAENTISFVAPKTTEKGYSWGYVKNWIHLFLNNRFKFYHLLLDKITNNLLMPPEDFDNIILKAKLPNLPEDPTAKWIAYFDYFIIQNTSSYMPISVLSKVAEALGVKIFFWEPRLKRKISLIDDQLFENPSPDDLHVVCRQDAQLEKIIFHNMAAEDLLSDKIPPISKFGTLRKAQEVTAEMHAASIASHGPVVLPPANTGAINVVSKNKDTESLSSEKSAYSPILIGQPSSSFETKDPYTLDLEKSAAIYLRTPEGIEPYVVDGYSDATPAQIREAYRKSHDNSCRYGMPNIPMHSGNIAIKVADEVHHAHGNPSFTRKDKPQELAGMIKRVLQDPSTLDIKILQKNAIFLLTLLRGPEGYKAWGSWKFFITQKTEATLAFLKFSLDQRCHFIHTLLASSAGKFQVIAILHDRKNFSSLEYWEFIHSYLKKYKPTPEILEVLFFPYSGQFSSAMQLNTSAISKIKNNTSALKESFWQMESPNQISWLKASDDDQVNFLLDGKDKSEVKKLLECTRFGAIVHFSTALAKAGEINFNLMTSLIYNLLKSDREISEQREGLHQLYLSYRQYQQKDFFQFLAEVSQFGAFLLHSDLIEQFYQRSFEALMQPNIELDMSGLFEKDLGNHNNEALKNLLASDTSDQRIIFYLGRQYKEIKFNNNAPGSSNLVLIKNFEALTEFAEENNVLVLLHGMWAEDHNIHILDEVASLATGEAKLDLSCKKRAAFLKSFIQYLDTIDQDEMALFVISLIEIQPGYFDLAVDFSMLNVLIREILRQEESDCVVNTVVQKLSPKKTPSDTDTKLAATYIALVNALVGKISFHTKKKSVNHYHVISAIFKLTLAWKDQKAILSTLFDGGYDKISIWLSHQLKTVLKARKKIEINEAKKLHDDVFRILIELLSMENTNNKASFKQPIQELIKELREFPYLNPESFRNIFSKNASGKIDDKACYRKTAVIFCYCFYDACRKEMSRRRNNQYFFVGDAVISEENAKAIRHVFRDVFSLDKNVNDFLDEEKEAHDILTDLLDPDERDAFINAVIKKVPTSGVSLAI